MKLTPQTLTILQGTSWGIAWPITDPTGTPIVVTGWSVRAQARPVLDSTEVLHEWSTTIGNATADQDRVTLTVTPAESSTWTFTTAVYDVELTDPGGRVARIAQGRLKVDREVTR